jgi:catechol 2,3-dioxygenase-like lactoylglutathione lyase family enzyme
MTEPAIGKFLAATVHVSDHDRARKFYSETLGFKIVDKNENLKLTMYDAGGLTFGTHVPWEGDTGRGIGGVTGLIFQTDDINAAFENLKARSVRIGEEPSKRDALNVIMGTFYDPDDNEFVVWQPLPGPGEG